MHKKQMIDKLIDEAMGSIDHVERATPKPFLLTRIHARLNQANETAWEKASWWIVRPAVAIPALTIVLLLNALVISFNGTDNFPVASEQGIMSTNDEFSDAVATIYDIENTEP